MPLAVGDALGFGLLLLNVVIVGLSVVVGQSIVSESDALDVVNFEWRTIWLMGFLGLLVSIWVDVKIVRKVWRRAVRGME